MGLHRAPDAAATSTSGGLAARGGRGIDFHGAPQGLDVKVTVSASDRLNRVTVNCIRDAVADVRAHRGGLPP